MDGQLLAELTEYGYAILAFVLICAAGSISDYLCTLVGL